MINIRSLRFFSVSALQPSITIMRHAESVWNAPRVRVQGQSRDPSICLSEVGRLSVKSELLHPSVSKPDILITSPLLRCIQTAEAWFEVPFVQIPIPTVIHADLREINAGDYEGRWLDELKNDLLWFQWMHHPHSFPGFPNGETLDQFANRLLRNISYICREHRESGKQVCLITHGVAMRVLKCFLADQDCSYLWTHQVANLERMHLSAEQFEKLERYPTTKKYSFTKQK